MHSCRKENGFAAVSIALLALLIAVFAGSIGCGGGGGGGGPTGGTGNVTLVGTLLDATTLAAPTSATITVNGHSTSANADGTFTLTGVAATATSATVSATGEQPRTLTLIIPKGTTTLDLGAIYLSPTGYTASASGTVVTSVKGSTQPVGGADVTIAGTSVLTALDGTFTINNLPIGLGTDPTTPIGTVTATGFASKPFYSTYVFTAGSNPLGNLLIEPPIGTNPPTLPYTIKGSVTQGNAPKVNASVEIVLNGQVLGTPVTTDANGNYYFWVVPGTYNIYVLGSTGQQIPPSPPTVTLTAPNVPVTVPTIVYQ